MGFHVKIQGSFAKICNISGVIGAMVQNLWNEQWKFNLQNIMKQSLQIGD